MTINKDDNVELLSKTITIDNNFVIESVIKTTCKEALPGMIVREKEPLNLEFPFNTLNETITPDNRFFVRSHFNIPQLNTDTWQLHINGEVEKEVTITYNDLLKLPAKTVISALECAGNGRINIVPKPKGLLWEKGAVGNTRWTGVPLSVLLEKAGIKQGTIEIILTGADAGEIKEEPKSPGVIAYSRSLPLTKAMQQEVLIVYQMNGNELTPEHGFPVRAIIPGWYGMASVKWLTQITATAKPFQGYWQTSEYSYWEHYNGMPSLTPVAEVQVKAEIARPALLEVIDAGKPYRIFGAAWAGEAAISKVEVSVDGGETWQCARLPDTPVRFAWQLWEYNWLVPSTPGKYKLMARATDEKRNVQPFTHDKNRKTYMINFISPVEIEVR